MSLTYPERTETNFPEAVDNLTRMSDLSFEDLPLVQQYYDLYNAGNLSGANALLEANPILKTKIFNAAKFNKLADGIGATQQFFKDNVDGYIQGKQDEFDTYIDDFRYLGDYNNSVSYVKKNIVYFSGYTYICRIPSNGVSPIVNETTANWGLISKKGDKGDQGVSGTGLSPRGQWNSATTYYKDDMVIDNNTMWQCLVENTNSKPDVSNTNWLKMIIDANVVVVSPTQPANQYLGCLWLKEG